MRLSDKVLEEADGDYEIKKKVADLWSSGKSVREIEDELHIKIILKGSIADQHKDLMSGNFEIETQASGEAEDCSVSVSRAEHDKSVPWSDETKALAQKAKRSDSLSGFVYTFPNADLAQRFKQALGLA